MDPQEAQRRIDAQASRDARLAVATQVIDNSGSLKDLEKCVEALWKKFLTAG
jgi:dephospho-CoA kinase